MASEPSKERKISDICRAFQVRWMNLCFYLEKRPSQFTGCAMKLLQFLGSLTLRDLTTLNLDIHLENLKASFMTTRFTHKKVNFQNTSCFLRVCSPCWNHWSKWGMQNLKSLPKYCYHFQMVKLLKNFCNMLLILYYILWEKCHFPN